MSSIQRIAYVPVKRRRGLYNLWSRCESDSLRKQICRLLGWGQHEASASNRFDANDAYNFFAALPDPSYTVDDLTSLELGLIQTRALFSKDLDMKSPIDKEAVAFAAFEDSERTCKDINDRLTSGLPLPEKGAEAIISIAKRKIDLILGECPSIDELPVRFGPGASATCRKTTSARWKLSTPPSISSSCFSYGVAALERAAGRWFESFGSLTVVPGELDFVPKNYKTHRSIVMEPSLTGALQRSVGSILKRRLYRAGIDLTNQSINRERARVGSVTGHYSTLDLSRASDSIAYHLVRELLPGNWFELLDLLRTPVVRYKNQLIELEKFSSMGNGYTFELESLLFYSIAYAVAVHEDHSRDISVYGDDIIVTSSLGEALFKWLPIFGFTPNVEKSFLDGPFRESCGFDSFLGVDVRPFYLKDRFTYHQIMSFHNFLQRKPWFDPDGAVRALLVTKLPPYFQKWGPDGYGDGHLVSNDDNLIPSYLHPHGRSKGFSGFVFYTFAAIPEKDSSECSGDLLLPFYHVESWGIDRVLTGSLLQNGRASPDWSPTQVSPGLGWTDTYKTIRHKNGRPKKYRLQRVYVLGVG